jgi:hypothetical protein
MTMTDQDQTGWLAVLVQMAQNGCPDTAHLNGPTLIIQEWMVVAERLGVILANDPTLELTGKYTQDGYEPGVTDVFFEPLGGVRYLGGVRESDGRMFDLKACASLTWWLLCARDSIQNHRYSV